MRPILVLEHEPDSPPGLFGTWLDERGLPWEHRRLVDGLPADLSAYAAVVSLGSTNSANDAEPWIDAELGFVQEAIERDVPVLGLCFGSQMLARAAGGAVGRSPQEEFGWVEPTGAASVITASPWFCWHGDAVTIPPGATLLADNDVAPQAYSLGRHVGFQFHPEVDVQTIERWMLQRALPKHQPLDLAPTAERFDDLLPGLVSRAYALFDWWLAQAGLAGGRGPEPAAVEPGPV